MAIDIENVLPDGAQPLSTSWMQLGTFETKGIDYPSAELFITLTRNDSTGIQFRLRERIESGGTAYPSNNKNRKKNETINEDVPEELDENASIEDTVKFQNINGTPLFLIIEARVKIKGTIAATINTAYFNKSYQPPSSDDRQHTIETATRTGSATLSDEIELNSSTSITVQAANEDRNFFGFSNCSIQSDVWLKLQAASVDDDKKGIFVAKKSYWEMPSKDKYYGEISAIAVVDAPCVNTTEF